MSQRQPVPAVTGQAPQSEIPDELIEAYRATEYVCGLGHDAFVLRIGVPSSPLAALYSSVGVSSAAYLTACNPKSEPQDAEANAEAHMRLGAELVAAGYQPVEGVAQDPAEHWPAEHSYLVLGITIHAAREIGRRYGQNAVVWTGADAVPELLLLR